MNKKCSFEYCYFPENCYYFLQEIIQCRLTATYPLKEGTACFLTNLTTYTERISGYC